MKDLGIKHSILKWGESANNATYYAIERGRKYGNILGEGGYGHVKKTWNIDTGDEAVYKIQIINPTMVDSEQEKIRIQKELDLITYLNEEKITNVNVIVRQSKDGNMQIEYVMPLAKGMNLHDYIDQKESHKLFRTPTQQTNDLLAVMLSYNKLQVTKDPSKYGNILHRDVKPDNIHIHIDEKTGTPTVSFIDFGLAKRLEKDRTEYSSSGCGGTPGYLPPEFFDLKSIPATVKSNGPFIFNEKTEVFALGVTLAQMIYPHFRSNCVDKQFQLRNGSHGTASYKPIPTDSLNPFAKMKAALVNQMINNDPDKRPTVKVILAELKDIQQKEQAVETQRKTAEAEAQRKVIEADLRGKVDTLQRLVNCVSQFTTNYLQLPGKHEHTNDCNILVNKIKEINIDSQSSATDKLYQIITILKEAHEDNRERYNNKNKLGFLGKKPTYSHYLNNNPKDHHYARFVILALQDTLKNDAVLDGSPELKKLKNECKSHFEEIGQIQSSKGREYAIFDIPSSEPTPAAALPNIKNFP